MPAPQERGVGVGSVDGACRAHCVAWHLPPPRHAGPAFDVGAGFVQFSRLNQIYRERQRQLAMGIDVLKEDDTPKDAKS